MNKITRFQDIKLFTANGSWECDYRPHEMLNFLDELKKTDKLQMDPDFQRAHVWTVEQQQKYLEFFFRGGKSARVIYINHPGWQDNYKGECVLLDGKQRVEAFRRFYNNEITIFGSYLKDFTDKPDNVMHTLRINVNNLKTRAEVLQWYIDFNSGGTVHTTEEIDKVRNLLEKEEDHEDLRRNNALDLNG